MLKELFPDHKEELRLERIELDAKRAEEERKRLEQLAKEKSWGWKR